MEVNVKPTLEEEKKHVPLMISQQEIYPFPTQNPFCVQAYFTSAIFIISCLDLLVFIITISFGMKRGVVVLTPVDETLAYGDLDYTKLRNFEIWRWITYAFLHADITHIFGNLVVQMTLGRVLEVQIGRKQTFIFYVLVCFIGALFPALMKIEHAVGASIAVYGMIGGILGFSLINWSYLDEVYRGRGKKCLTILYYILFFSFILIWELLTPNNASSSGHLSGLVTGFFLLFVLHQPYRKQDGACCIHKYYYYCSVILLTSFTFVGLICFYALKNFQVKNN